MRRVLPLAALVVLAGCAYYNGLYNANRLADEARKAEREGRRGESRSLWSQAAVKAESVAVRFPDSRWWDDAVLLWGRALRQTDACSRAVRPLAAAADSSTDPVIVGDARILLAECRLFMREPDSAVAVLGPLVETPGPRRAEALALRARANLAAGHLDAALDDASRADAGTTALIEATALARLGRGEEAVARVEGLVDGPFTETEWTEVLEAIAGTAPAEAARLAARLAQRSDLGTGARARILLADAERWLAARDPGRATAPLSAAAALAPDSISGRAALAHLLMVRLRQLASPDSVASLLEEIRRVTGPGGRPVQIAGRALTVLPRVTLARQLGDSPAHLFLAAEGVRDTLQAFPLAGALFLEVARQADDQVLAPKAIVAAMMLLPERADSLHAVVRDRYGSSVYARALRGEADDRYRVVEDSLRTVFAALSADGQSERRRPVRNE